MMQQKEQIRQYCQRFKITGVSTHLDRTINHAERESLGFMDFTVSLFKTEAEHRQQNELRKRLKAARLPKTHDLNGYDNTVENGLPKTRPGPEFMTTSVSARSTSRSNSTTACRSCSAWTGKYPETVSNPSAVTRTRLPAAPADTTE